MTQDIGLPTGTARDLMLERVREPALAGATVLVPAKLTLRISTGNVLST